MLEALLILVAGLLGWLLARRQKPTEPPVTPPNKSEPPKFEDKIDEITQGAKNTGANNWTDDELRTWLDETYGSKRK